jgi:uncharacterized protein YcsI (UPF0317 family)
MRIASPAGLAFAGLPPSQARAQFRTGTSTPTAGWSLGYAQANLLAVPREWAYDVLLFAQRNPKACPVLDVTEVGSWTPPSTPGADLRVDLPRYRVWRDGEVVQEPIDVTHVWTDDIVGFLFGCSFTFESALVDAGVPLRHVEQGVNVPMYRTVLPCRPAGRLHASLVVSMRPIPACQVATAVTASARFPGSHGAPVHVGAPELLGIADLDEPDYGDPVRFEDGDVAVFWACGVTSQAAVMASQSPFAITHVPGHMFITDILEADIRER